MSEGVGRIFVFTRAYPTNCRFAIKAAPDDSIPFFNKFNGEKICASRKEVMSYWVIRRENLYGEYEKLKTTRWKKSKCAKAHRKPLL